MNKGGRIDYEEFLNFGSGKQLLEQFEILAKLPILKIFIALRAFQSAFCVWIISFARTSFIN